MSEFQDKAKKLFGVAEADFSYITDELIQADAALGSEAEVAATPAVLYGNNARYGARVINGVTYQVYYFDNSGDYTNPSHACGNGYTAWARQDVWHHKYLGKCPNGREKWSFHR